MFSKYSFTGVYNLAFPKTISWDGSRFVMLGGGGIADLWVATSSDGNTWSHSALTIDDHLNSLAATSNLYIAAGDDAIYYSTDAINWISGYTDDNSRVYSAYYDANYCRFLVGGTNGMLIATTNGSTWQDLATGITATDTITDITHNGTGYLAAGYDSNGKCRLYSSSDATAWSASQCNGDYALYAIAHNGQGEWVAVGGHGAIVPSSSDTGAGVVDITTLRLPNRLTEIASDGNSYLAAGREGGMWRSTGEPDWQWVQVDNGIAADIIYLDYDGTRWVCIDKESNSFASDDGTTWTNYKDAIGYSVNVKDLARYYNMEIAVGSSIWATSDGASFWLDNEPQHEYNAITTTDNKIVIVGNYGYILTGSRLSELTESSPVTESLNDVATDGSRFVAVGGNEMVLWSDDGNTWNKATVNNTEDSLFSDFKWIEWDGNRYVAMSYNGMIPYLWYSENGTEWNHTRVPSYIDDIIWTGSKYVAISTLVDGFDFDAAIMEGTP